MAFTALTLVQLTAVVKTLLKEAGTTYWSAAEFTQIITDVLREVSRAKPRVLLDATIDTVADTRLVDVSGISDALDGIRSIKKIEYPTGNWPRSYRNFTFYDEDNIELDVDTVPDDAYDLNIIYDAIHTLSTTSTLTAQLEDLVIEGVVARSIIQWCQNTMVQIAAGIARLATASTAVGLVTARVDQAVTDIASGRTEAAKVAAIIDSAATEIGLINPEVDQAVADVDSGRAFINTLSVGQSPEAMYAQYANTGLNDAAGYLRAAQGYFTQAANDESIARTYQSAGRTELNSAVTTLRKAQGYLNIAATDMSAARAMRVYQNLGNQKLAMYLRNLSAVKARRVQQQHYTTS